VRRTVAAGMFLGLRGCKVHSRLEFSGPWPVRPPEERRRRPPASRSRGATRKRGPADWRQVKENDMAWKEAVVQQA